MSPRIAGAAVLLLLLVSCAARAPKPWSEILPGSLEGGWQRSEISDVSLDQAPPVLRSLGVVRAARALYRGPSDVQVTAYHMARGTAFEAAQKWRVETGRNTYIYKGDYFFVARTETGKESLDRFASALDHAIGSGPH